MKKLVSLLLCALMVMSLFATAFAASAAPRVTCTHPNGWTLYRATCNGTTQTWYYRCAANCGATYTDTISCPAGPHNPGHCDRLPI